MIPSYSLAFDSPGISKDSQRLCYLLLWAGEFGSGRQRSSRACREYHSPHSLMWVKWYLCVSEGASISYKNVHLEIPVTGKNVSILNFFFFLIIYYTRKRNYFCFISSTLLELQFLCSHSPSRFITLNHQCGKVVPSHCSVYFQCPILSAQTGLGRGKATRTGSFQGYTK